MWSTLYWLAVAVGTVAFAFDVGEVYSRRERDRFYPEAVGLYVLAVSLWAGLETLVVVLARAIAPKQHFWTGAPTAVVAGALIVVIGGHVIGGTWDWLRHRDTGPKPVLERLPRPEELAAAEAYDDRWQAEYRAEHRSKPRFSAWHAEYLRMKKRRSEKPDRKAHRSRPGAG